MNILIVDDHSLVRMSMKIILEKQYNDAVLLEAENYKSTLKLVADNRLDLVILDINIPGGVGTGMIRQITEIQPNVHILICTASEEEQTALDYIRAGAGGYLSKSVDESEIIAAISTVMNNKRYISTVIQERLLDVMGAGKSLSLVRKIKRLSARENEITRLLLAGKWVKEIASILNLRANTISTHKSRIFEKMGVDSVSELKRKLMNLEEG